MTPTNTFTAVATHDGAWWVVEVDGVGTTQGRTTGEAERMAADLVAAMRRLPRGEIDMAIKFRASDM